MQKQQETMSGKKEEKASPPKECRKCKTAHNGINGRFCELKMMYVEHQTKPICKPQKIKKQ